MNTSSKPNLDRENADKIENLINSDDTESSKLGWELLYQHFNISSWILHTERIEIDNVKVNKHFIRSLPHMKFKFDSDGNAYITRFKDIYTIRLL